MSSLLTHDEYLALSTSLTFPCNAVIGGKSTPAISGRTFDTVNPATGECAREDPLLQEREERLI